jgi:hypothetical protein
MIAGVSRASSGVVLARLCERLTDQLAPSDEELAPAFTDARTGGQAP